MKRRKFLNSMSGMAGLMVASPALLKRINQRPFIPVAPSDEMPGVWKFTIGESEKITPVTTRRFSPYIEGLKSLQPVEVCPVSVNGSVSDRGTLIRIPLKKDELIYGLGLQLQSFQQRGLKKMLRVNADPEIDSGDSHAPVPFFVTTSGYGVMIDTARYATFYLGNKKRRPEAPLKDKPLSKGEDGWNALNGPYERLGLGEESDILVEIPRSEGVDVYVFAGPGMKEAVQRYNLYSGGGALPPRWGLGFWYRVHSDCTQDEMFGMADEFRKRKIPCDVLGLEPHWQTHSYSSSYVWSQRFPDPAAMLSKLKSENYRVNMWLQAFVHPSSPIYNDLLPNSGDYEVWGGIVPDFITEEAKKIFTDYHIKTHIDIGISGYKADECDNSDYTGNWSFPEISRFPSGADGEQMHCLFGQRYQDAVMKAFEEKQLRTYGLVRSSGALAAPYPFVLYSDLYTHRNFIHAVAQSGFSGLLWTPEVRHATSETDLIRRLQTVVLSPLAMVNGWYLKNPPWKQIERRANNVGQFATNWEELESQCREIINLRMKLIPYIHAAFVRYHKTGLPPFRALVLDYPDDPKTSSISDQYMMGDSVMVAPVTIERTRRNVYLPAGIWYDFWTKEKIEGGVTISVEVPIDRIPVYIKAGSVLPLAKVTLHTEDPESRILTVTVWGEGDAQIILYEDDGSWNPQLINTTLVWDYKRKKGKLEREGKPGELRYSVENWENVI